MLWCEQENPPDGGGKALLWIHCIKRPSGCPIGQEGVDSGANGDAGFDFLERGNEGGKVGWNRWARGGQGVKNCRVTKERAFGSFFKGEMLTIRGSSPILGNCRDGCVCDLGRDGL